MEPKTAAEHYQLAYALDCAAEDYCEVERHYQRTIELDPTEPQYHSSWVHYLQTRALPQATRDAWAAAIKSCPHAYDALHFPVAQLALYHAQLEFAEDVLLSVLVDKRVGDLAILWDMLQLLLLVDDGQKEAMPDELEERFAALPPIFPDSMRYIRKWCTTQNVDNKNATP